MKSGAMRLGPAVRWIAVLVLTGAGVFFAQHRYQAHRFWTLARPRLPRVENWPVEFRQRIQTADARVALWPPEPAALGDLARLYLVNGFQPQAEQTLRALLRYDPQNAHWPHYLATLQAGYGQLEEAIVLWRRVVMLAPDYRTGRLKLGEALLKTNRLDEAEKVYRDIIAQSPGEIYAELGLAQIDIEEGRWGDARKHLEESVKTEPLYSAGWALLATVDERLGDSGEGEQAREKANVLGRFKDVPDPWTDELVDFCYDPYRLEVMAATITATGGGETAVPILQRAVQVAPTDSTTHRQLGKLYFQLHKNDLARGELQRAIELQPTEPRAYLDLVNLDRAQGDSVSALALLQQAIEKCTGADGLHLELGVALLAANRADEALPYLKKAEELAPDNPVVYQEIAKAQFKLTHTAEALDALKVGLQRNPEAAGLLAMLAGYEIQTGDALAAEQHLARAMKADSNQRDLPSIRESFAQKFGREPLTPPDGG